MQNRFSYRSALGRVVLAVSLLCVSVSQSPGNEVSRPVSDVTSSATEASSPTLTEGLSPAQSAVDGIPDPQAVLRQPDSLTLGFAGLFVVAAFFASRRRYRKLVAEFEREMGERWL